MWHSREHRFAQVLRRRKEYQNRGKAQGRQSLHEEYFTKPNVSSFLVFCVPVFSSYRSLDFLWDCILLYVTGSLAAFIPLLWNTDSVLKTQKHTNVHHHNGCTSNVRRSHSPGPEKYTYGRLLSNIHTSINWAKIGWTGNSWSVQIERSQLCVFLFS